jgi:hypothetical protein
MVPSILLLVAAIIQSTDRLFFVLHKIGNNNAWKWHLSQLAFMDSMALYPLCMLEGRFLFEFYIWHPADWHYNAVNQQYWLQLHNPDNITSCHSSSNNHLVCPSETSESYSSRHKLLFFIKWLSTSHLDTYIHGPFEFPTICSQKTLDHISQGDWNALSKHQSMFSNPLPWFDVPTYSIHIDRRAHVTFHDHAL